MGGLLESQIPMEDDRQMIGSGLRVRQAVRIE